MLGGPYEAPSRDRLNPESRRVHPERAAAGATRRVAKPTPDGVRHRQVRRLPRGDGPPRLLAWAPHLHAVRREGPPLPPARRPRLDPSRRTHESFVTGKEQTT